MFEKIVYSSLNKESEPRISLLQINAVAHIRSTLCLNLIIVVQKRTGNEVFTVPKITSIISRWLTESDCRAFSDSSFTPPASSHKKGKRREFQRRVQSNINYFVAHQAKFLAGRICPFIPNVCL